MRNINVLLNYKKYGIVPTNEQEKRELYLVLAFNRATNKQLMKTAGNYKALITMLEKKFLSIDRLVLKHQAAIKTEIDKK